MILRMYAAVEEMPAAVLRFADESPLIRWIRFYILLGVRIPPLWRAAARGRTAEVRRLLVEGADIEEKGGRRMLECTPLRIAAEEGREEVVIILLEHGADVSAKANAINYGGATPLGDEKVQRHEAIVLLLLDHFADVSAKDNAGRTPLHRAESRVTKRTA